MATSHVRCWPTLMSRSSRAVLPFKHQTRSGPIQCDMMRVTRAMPTERTPRKRTITEVGGIAKGDQIDLADHLAAAAEIVTATEARIVTRIVKSIAITGTEGQALVLRAPRGMRETRADQEEEVANRI